MFWSHDIVFCVCATYFLWTQSYLIGREIVCFEKHNIYRHDTSITNNQALIILSRVFYEKNFAWKIFIYMIDNFQNLQFLVNKWNYKHNMRCRASLYFTSSPTPPLPPHLFGPFLFWARQSHRFKGLEAANSAHYFLRPSSVRSNDK